MIRQHKKKKHADIVKWYVSDDMPRTTTSPSIPVRVLIVSMLFLWIHIRVLNNLLALIMSMYIALPPHYNT